MRIRISLRSLLLILLFAAVQTSQAQANLSIYTDNLVNAFQNWSWATVDLANASPVQSGSDSISVTTSNYSALYLEHPNFNTSPYASLRFWINGGPGGGQKAKVVGLLDGGSAGSYSLGPLAPAVWQQITVPLSALGLADQSNCSGIWIQSTVGGSQPAFYVDDIQFVAAPAPALVHLGVDAAQPLRAVDARQFGVNTAVWDGYLDTASTSNALRELGCLALRFPGGSLSDEYHWATGKSANNPWAWATSFGNFMHVATNLGAKVFITVNYGTGTSNEAAAWVRSANLTNHCGFQYWEIGNECYGSWETDTNVVSHDPYTYAQRAANYIQLMKQADPTIKVGVVGVTGEDSYANNTLHPAYNPRTGQTHNGWTPVLLTTLKNLGVTPDFMIYHFYPEYTPPPPPSPPPANDSDPFLLQASVNWAGDAADLRQQISDYFGPAGTNLELVVTENNSDAGAFGRQLTSLVNGLYLADSLGQLMKTEFNAYLWWDLRNGPDNNGSFDPTLYGWRTYGDEGIIYNSSATAVTKYPTFYAMKLMQYFARPGDSVLASTSDYLLLSVYATRHADGSLGVLVINKDSSTNFNGQIAISNYVPWTNAVVRSYGIPQDEAARTNGTAEAQDISATNHATAGPDFTYSFPPYSLTLFTLPPAAPTLSVYKPDPNRVVLQLHGQPGVRYLIQESTDLTIWNSVATNTLTGAELNFTNLIAPGSSEGYWRAAWQP